MVVTIYPSTLSGAIQAPPSKSDMQRACAAALLSTNTCIIHNYGKSNDDKTALEIIKNLGAEITYIDQYSLSITSHFNEKTPINTIIHCGESGLSVRMFTSILSLYNSPITTTGEGSLNNRPMHFFERVLPQLGVEFDSERGHLPFKIKGPLKPASITIDGSLSSQYLTGLLFAFSYYLNKYNHEKNIEKLAIEVIDLKSHPYIDLTLKTMEKFGMTLPINENYKRFTFDAFNNNRLQNTPTKYTIEGDWSGAAFLLVGAAINGEIMVEGLDMTSPQADKNIVDVLQKCNADIKIEGDNIAVRKSKLSAFDFDATHCPDLFPPLVALAAHCHGTSTIIGVSRLTHKESNRALTLQEEFGKLGVSIEIEDDLMRIMGTNKLQGNVVHSRNDHRIAMACAVASLTTSSPTSILEADAVKKSYPDFYTHLSLLGVKIEHSISQD